MQYQAFWKFLLCWISAVVTGAVVNDVCIRMSKITEQFYTIKLWTLQKCRTRCIYKVIEIINWNVALTNYIGTLQTYWFTSSIMRHVWGIVKIELYWKRRPNKVEMEGNKSSYHLTLYFLKSFLFLDQFKLQLISHFRK